MTVRIIELMIISNDNQSFRTAGEWRYCCNITFCEVTMMGPGKHSGPFLMENNDMEKTRNGLIEHCNSKIGTPYVFGAKGESMTQARIDQLARENPGTYTSAYKYKAAKYIGQHCTDCSGLISWYTGRIRGSYNYYDTAVERVNIDHLDESMTGWALWKPGHIGVFIGNGWCIEAKGINYGTIKTKVSATAWQKVLKLCDIDYSSDQVPVTYHEGFQPTADGQRWWYQYSDGSYACNGWYWLREATDGTCGWYLFDREGNMLTGYQLDPAGEAFLLCPDKGSNEGKCMITDARGVLRIVEEYDFDKRQYKV